MCFNFFRTTVLFMFAASLLSACVPESTTSSDLTSTASSQGAVCSLEARKISDAKIQQESARDINEILKERENAKTVDALWENNYALWNNNIKWDSASIKIMENSLKNCSNPAYTQAELSALRAEKKDWYDTLRDGKERQSAYHQDMNNTRREMAASADGNSVQGLNTALGVLNSVVGGYVAGMPASNGQSGSYNSDCVPTEVKNTTRPYCN